MGETFQYILAIDSAVQGSSVTVYNAVNPDESVTKTNDQERGQAETLVPLINDVVFQAGISFKDIDCIATTKGPGTFTGLRVGLAAAKSFALALSKTIIGFSTLDVIAQDFFNQNTHSNQQLCVLLESKRSDFYCQIWDEKQNEVLTASALSADSIVQHLKDETVFIGNALERFKGDVESKDSFEYLTGFHRPNTSVLAQMAIHAFEKGGNENQDVQPLYLREADVSVSKKTQRQLAK